MISGDKFAGVDNAAEFERGLQTKVIDKDEESLQISMIRICTSFAADHMELRWEGVPSLSLALQMLGEQALEHLRRNGCGT